MDNLFFDLETTSLDTGKCQIVQIAVLNQRGVCLMAGTFGVLLNVFESKEIQIRGLNYNNYNLDYAEKLPIFSENDLQRAALLFENHRVWAHNISFDRSVLEATAKRLCPERNLFANQQWFCTMELANPKRRTKLPQLCADSVAHDAVSDTRNCFKLWEKLTEAGAERSDFQVKAF